jgi:hypothetical protein
MIKTNKTEDLTHCIDIMSKELDAKGMEVYESSAKSL